jgi:thymidylate kinase
VAEPDPSAPTFAAALWERLDAAGIAACLLWHGETFGAPGAEPAARLEILLERRAAAAWLELLAAMGCKPLRGGSADVLALDQRAARPIAIRARFALPLHDAGAGCLPWVGELLRSRQRAAGCDVPEPGLSLLLLAVWAAASTPTGARAWRGLQRSPASKPAIAACATAADRLLGAPAAAALRAFLEQGCGAEARRRWRRAVAPALAPFRGHRPAGRLRPARQRPAAIAAGGLIVALLGSDGSGKSTVSNELVRWLQPAVRVERIYFGSGQGPSSLLRWPLLLAHRIASRRTAPARGDEGTTTTAARRRGLRALLRPLWALLLAREKRARLRSAWRARARGAVVVCDRYPQNEIMGFNDGPLLDGWLAHRSRWRRALARWERQPYAWAQRRPPDLVIKLRVTAAVALARKPDMTPDEVRRRIAAVDSLQLGAPGAVFVVDADAPLADVVAAVHRRVWAEL